MGAMRVVMGVGTVGEDAFQFRRENSVGLVPPTLGPNLFNRSVCGIYPSEVVSPIFTSPPGAFVHEQDNRSYVKCSPCTVQELNLAFRSVTSCDDIIVVVFRIRAVSSWVEMKCRFFYIY